MKLNAALGALMATTLAIAAMQLAPATVAGQGLVPRYYSTKNCSRVEHIVREEVVKALAANHSNGAALIRLFFHDCWVYGCDGSVLLDASALNPVPEKKANASIGLRGFDVIQTIKDRLEDTYPGTVSCADILAFAARDAACILSGGHINYTVPSGRRDGVVSRAKDAQDTLPSSTSSFDDLKTNFVDKKKFTVEELVVLSGAHSIGDAHYESYKDRLAAPASEIDAKYQYALREAKRQGRSVVANDIRDEDVAFQTDAEYHPATPSPRGSLDNTYYYNAIANRVLFRSDWALLTNGFALGKLKEYRDKPREWDSDFANAMVKLSKLPAEGKHFEIRKKCSATNKLAY